LDAQSPDRIVEVLGEDLVSIVDQVAVPLPFPTTSRNCCRVQSAVGFAVTLICARRRVLCSITTNTYNIRNVAVTAMKKSHARIAFAWFFRKVDQR
jgi:hypothetical protein